MSGMLSDRFDLQVQRNMVETGSDGYAGQRLGSWSATLAGVRSDGARVTVMLTEDDYEALRSADDPEAVALRLLDDATSPHILAIEGPPF